MKKTLLERRLNNQKDYNDREFKKAFLETLRAG